MIVPLEKLPSDDIHPFALLSPRDREDLEYAATTDVSILFVGETGTGKGQMARAACEKSHRPDLIEVNCSALPDELLGSELFGHKRGSFTGAVSDREGILLSSEGKTVFLDEIGEISLKMQRMLLGVVQRSRRSIKPLGSDREVLLRPMRFIFATNRDLEQEVAEGRFREDLLRRIDVVTVRLPALRERPDLIPGYAGKFLAELSRLHGIPCRGIEQKALTLLARHSWPGNVRELKNVLERALVTAPRGSRMVVAADRIRFPESPLAGRLTGFPSLRESEADHLRKAVVMTGGNVAKMIQLLGLGSRTALRNRLKKHRLAIEEILSGQASQ